MHLNWLQLPCQLDILSETPRLEEGSTSGSGSAFRAGAEPGSDGSDTTLGDGEERREDCEGRRESAVTRSRLSWKRPRWVKAWWIYGSTGLDG
eukprot:Skav214010  [mRNA]  locus=scaffold1070:360391:361542:+ [translate_table: standard]